MFEKRKKIGLALGSGGAKGLAHIGVIKVLEENNIQIDFIAGSSIGALVGGFYAAKKYIKEVEKIVHDLGKIETISMFFDPTLNQGLITGKKLGKFIEKHIGNINFNELKIPFTAVTTDFKTNKTIPVKNHDVVSAIKASCAVPFIFKPIVDDQYILVDGGLSMPIPVQVVKQMGADIVIAVNLYQNCHHEEMVSLNLPSIPVQTINMLLYNLALENAKTADIVINPKVGQVSWRSLLSKKDRSETIKLGEEAMKEKLPQLKKLLSPPKENLLNRFFNFLEKKGLVYFR